jgi:hypothetical protein
LETFSAAQANFGLPHSMSNHSIARIGKSAQHSIVGSSFWQL